MIALVQRRAIHLWLSLFIGICLAIVTTPAVASAQYHARLSSDLAAALAQPGATDLHVVLEAPQSEVDRIVATYGVTVVKRLQMGAVLAGTGDQIAALADDANVAALSEDAIVRSTMAVVTQATGASQLWAGDSGAFGGLTGSGVVVGIIDSGVSLHPDVAKRLKLSVDFTGDTSGNADGYGHGTHIAGIIAGNGGGSHTDAGNTYVGMAPGAELVSLRVLGADGTGYVSDVIAALEWSIKNKDRYQLRVLNISLGRQPTTAPSDDPLAQAVERAVSAGLVVVASAGNVGTTVDGQPIVGAIVSPGDTPGALTVGTLNTMGTVDRSDDTIASYSSRGPVGDEAHPESWQIKPDIVAPGNAVVAAGATDSYLWQNYPERRVVGTNGGSYLKLSGSSMAAAVVSGAVAQLLQANPGLTPAQVKFALQYTAEPLADFGLIDQGAGSLDVPLALAAATALANGGNLSNIPNAVEIGGQMIEAGHVAFFDKATWAGSTAGATMVVGNTIVWGSRDGNGGVGGNTIIWGNRDGSGGVGGNTIIWGNRDGNGGVGGNTIIWGNRDGNGGVGGNTIIWGNRDGNGGVGGNTIIWGNRDGNTGVGGNAVTF
jgi:serine protease AprX